MKPQLRYLVLNFFSFQVLQSDGGNYCASVNAATLALMDAGIPMKDYVIACSGSHMRDTPIVDMNHLEESSGGAEVIMAILPRCDQVRHCSNLRSMAKYTYMGVSDSLESIKKFSRKTNSVIYFKDNHHI